MKNIVFHIFVQQGPLGPGFVPLGTRFPVR